MDTDHNVKMLIPISLHQNSSLNTELAVITYKHTNKSSIKQLLNICHALGLVPLG